MVSFIHKASCCGLLFLLCACGGGSGESGTANTTTANSMSAGGSNAVNDVSSEGQTVSDPPTSSSGSSSSPGDAPCSKISQPPCSGAVIDPVLTLEEGSSEPLPQNSCKGDASLQCSGANTLQIAHHIALTTSGVHTYGVSTSELSGTADPNNPVGLKIASGGTVEVRSTRSKDSMPSGVALILSNIGLSWDGKTERPPVIETFSTTQKRVELNSNGFLLFKDLPAPEDVSFYDYGQLGKAATQSHYANNIYFPRPEGVNCTGSKLGPCRSSESPPLAIEAGNWRTGGKQPDKLAASHYHLDGAVEVSSSVPSTTTISDNTISIDQPSPFGNLTPGVQGSRHFQQWSYGWSNLGLWDTQDKVNMAVWGGSQDVQKRIVGTVAYGTASLADRIPQSGTAIYSGNVYGWLSYDYAASTIPFFANANVTVDFANNSAVFIFSKTRTVENDDADFFLAPVQTTLNLDRQKFKNYLSGRIDFLGMQGGVGARFFGPITTSGSGIAPVEMAGSFSMQCEQVRACPVLIGGFLLRKQ